MKNIFLFLAFVLILGCSSERDKHLKTALELASNNRKELERVLVHYKNDPQKLAAAQFLIENMPGNFSIDPDIEVVYEPFYCRYDSINQLYPGIMTQEKGEIIDSLWKAFYTRPSPTKFYPDCEKITSSYLIKEIDRSFCTWRNNVYSQNINFKEFLEYILPFRRENKLIIENSRAEFYQKHHFMFYSTKGKNFINETDSLLYLYRNISHTQKFGINIPIYSCRTLQRIQKGLCSHRCWFNSTLLSALGMPVGIDIVPAWGNRNNSHTWNVLIFHGQSYAFEANWDEDRWKYKDIYNNKISDKLWGKFRLPKVYRNTYSNHLEGPLADKRVKMSDIPPLFRNFKKIDVSHEYFDTQDVTIPLQDIPINTNYAYLCVFGYQQWHPVQWGEIKDKHVCFRAMGKDIIYLPAYYSNGSLKYATDPFLLNSKGEIETLKASSRKRTVIVRGILGAPTHSQNRDYTTCMTGTKIFALSDNQNSKLLGTITSSLFIDANWFKSNSTSPCRYIRLQLPSDSIALSDLSFFSGKTKIQDIKILTPLIPLNPLEKPEWLVDKYTATAYRGKSSQKYVDIDLGKEYTVSNIRMLAYVKSELTPDNFYELFYWDNGWHSIGKQQGNNNFLVFKDVPDSCLLMLKNCSWDLRSTERIFLSKDGEIIWF